MLRVAALLVRAGCRLALFGLIGGLVAVPALARAQASPDLAQALPSVVRVSLVGRDDYGNFYLHSVGSGFVAAPERVVTNSHVIRGALEQDNLLVVITPHEGFGERLIIGRVLRENTEADLALIAAPDLNAPSARIAMPPPHTGIVNAVGYPALMCDLLDCTADERIAPSVPDFSSGPISRFADRTPRGGAVKTIFHRAAISGGNSGGPIVDQCGRVVGVNAWTSAAFIRSDGSVDAPSPVSIATHAEPLMAFLEAAGLTVALDATRCRTAEDANLELQREVEALKLSLAAQEAARVEAAQSAAVAAARQADSNRLTLFGGVAVVLLIGGGMMFWIRHRRSGERGAIGADATPGPRGNGIVIAAGAAGVALVVAVLIYALAPRTGPAPPAETKTDKGETVLSCTLDAERSVAHLATGDAMALEFDRSTNCVNGRTPYLDVSNGYERVIVSSQEPRVTLNRFDASLGAFTQDSYVVNAETWSDLKQKAAGLAKGCATAQADRQNQKSALEALRTGVEGRLPSAPSRRSVWTCREAVGSVR